MKFILFVLLPLATGFQHPRLLGLKSPVHRSKSVGTTCQQQDRSNIIHQWSRPPLSHAVLVRQGKMISSSSLRLTGSDLSALAESVFRNSGSFPFLEALGINGILFVTLLPKLSTMLTPAGLIHAFALGSTLWASLGWKGWMYCVMYFFLGQAVTKLRFAEKEKAGLAEGRGGRRGPENVWGSAATGLLCAVCSAQGTSFLGISSDLFLLGYVASMATKLADTFASEVGKAYGKTVFLITTMERVEPGTEGAVSAEGTAASVVGGLALSAIGFALGMVRTYPAVVISTIAAFIATNIESLLGATLQEKKGFQWMTNEVINFINTFIGATLAMVAGALVLNI
ncbi:hypothetical protein ACA910_016647 [Epithemia clementina (nom. ined.)]